MYSMLQVLLKPSLPAAPIDAYFLELFTGGLSSIGAEVWQAPSFIPITAAAAAAAESEAGEIDSSPPGGLIVQFSAANRSPRGGGAELLGITFPDVTACPFVTVLVASVPLNGFVLYPSDITPSLDTTDTIVPPLHTATTAATTPIITTASTSATTISNTTTTGGACALSGLAVSYVGVAWSPGIRAMASVCANGSPVSGCVTPFSGSSPLTLGTGTGNATTGVFPFELISLSPVLRGGYALLGELDKFVRASPVRFTRILAAEAPPSLSFGVNGAGGESLNVTVMAPATAVPGVAAGDDAVILSVGIAFGAAGGTASVTCAGSGTAARCGVVSMRHARSGADSVR